MAIDFPNSPATNDVFTAAGRSWVWNGLVWRTYGNVPTISASDSAPANPVANQMWYESDTGKTFIWYDGFWVEIGHANTAVQVDSGTYTPTLTGMAIGTGGGAANTATWSAINCGTYWQMHLEGELLFGTSGATFPSDGKFGPPSGWQFVSNDFRQPVGQCTLVDNGTSSFTGTLWADSTTTLRLIVQNVAGTYPIAASTSTTVPFTWVAGDSIVWTADLHVVPV